MGIPVAVLEASEAASLGVAMLGGKAAGIVDDLRAMAARVVKIRDVFEPNPKRNAVYEELFSAYRSLYPAIREINWKLAMLEEKA